MTTSEIPAATKRATTAKATSAPGCQGWRQLPNALPLGLAGTVILALASYGAGATRSRGGVIEALGLGFVTFGHGRNISILLYWVGIFLFVGAWIIAGKSIAIPTITGAKPVATAYRRLRTILWVWLLPLFVAGPLASRDVYSYLMQGAMVRDGFDPYTEGAASDPGPFLVEVSRDWRNTTTPYGPLHLGIGDVITTLVGDNVALGVACYKLVSILGFTAIAWAIPHIARALGGNEALALWLGVANPVMIIHLVGGMHNESVMVGLISLGLLCTLRGRCSSAIAGIALIGMAVALKATAFIALPFVAWILMHRLSAPAATGSSPRRAKAIVLALSSVVIVLETIAVVFAVTLATRSSWGWLSEISGNSKVINPLAAPTLATDITTPLIQLFAPEVTYNEILGHARTIGMGLMVLGLVASWIVARRSVRQAIFGTVAAYQVAFVFNSVTLPWYYASVISLLGVAAPPRWLLKLSTAACLVVAISFAGDGNHQLYNWWWDLGAIAGGIACVEWLYGGLPKAPPAKRHSVGFPNAAGAKE